MRRQNGQEKARATQGNIGNCQVWNIAERDDLSGGCGFELPEGRRGVQGFRTEGFKSAAESNVRHSLYTTTNGVLTSGLGSEHGHTGLG